MGNHLATGNGPFHTLMRMFFSRPHSPVQVKGIRQPVGELWPQRTPHPTWHLPPLLPSSARLGWLTCTTLQGLSFSRFRPGLVPPSLFPINVAGLAFFSKTETIILRTQTLSMLVSAHFRLSDFLEEGHPASGSKIRRLLLGKNLCADGFCSRNQLWRIYWYLSRHEIGNFSWLYPTKHIRDIFAHFISSNWNALLAYQYPIHSSRKECLPLKNLPRCLRFQLPVPPSAVIVTAFIYSLCHLLWSLLCPRHNWIPSREKGKPTCGLISQNPAGCLIQSNDS